MTSTSTASGSSAPTSPTSTMSGAASLGRRSVPLVGDEPAMRDWAAELVDRARSEGVELTGDGGLLTALVRQVLQTGLEVEMTDHVGYEPHAIEGRGSGNSRNGTYPKTVTTEIGKVDLRVPPRPQRDLRPGHGPQGRTPPGRLGGQRHLALRQGHDHRGHPGTPGGDLRDRHLPRHDQPHH
jgi:hypothetical protein